jgi:hypothetical protein
VLGLAFRLGVPRGEQISGATVDETVTDLYIVARERLSVAPWLSLHAGVRISSATIALTGEPGHPSDFSATRRLVLPTGGIELAMNKESRLVGEISAAPQFSWMPGADPTIGYGVLSRFGMRWALLPSVILDGTIGYQMDLAMPAGGPRDVVSAWDIRLGAEVFVPWGALACRAVGAFCD